MCKIQIKIFKFLMSGREKVNFGVFNSFLFLRGDCIESKCFQWTDDLVSYLMVILVCFNGADMTRPCIQRFIETTAFFEFHYLSQFLSELSGKCVFSLTLTHSVLSSLITFYCSDVFSLHDRL